ncbi:MAG: hypothetical protein PHS57_07800 [Alphaproteobacteria bacterium]|nr:hypothetical protein [Alphaproteobacteria bacterium]
MVALSAAGFVFVAVLWLRKLRDAVSTTLSETARQQINSTQHMAEAIARLQKQQDSHNEQIRALAQAGLHLQQEISNISERLNTAESETIRFGQTLH